MTRIFMRAGGSVLTFDVAERLDAVKKAMEPALSAFARLTCVHSDELAHLVYLRIDDIVAVEEHDTKWPRPTQIETELER